MAYLYQQRKFLKEIYYEGSIIYALPYPHGGQLQPCFPMHRDPPLWSISGRPYLKLEVLSLLPRTHIFWGCQSLNLWFMPPHTSPLSSCSEKYSGHTTYLPSYNGMNDPVQKSCWSHRMLGEESRWEYQGATARHPWTHPRMYQYHPGISEGQWSTHHPHRTIPISVCTFCTQFLSGPSVPPYTYVP